MADPLVWSTLVEVAPVLAKQRCKMQVVDEQHVIECDISPIVITETGAS